MGVRKLMSLSGVCRQSSEECVWGLTKHESGLRGAFLVVVLPFSALCPLHPASFCPCVLQ